MTETPPSGPEGSPATEHVRRALDPSDPSYRRPPTAYVRRRADPGVQHAAISSAGAAVAEAVGPRATVPHPGSTVPGSLPPAPLARPARGVAILALVLACLGGLLGLGLGPSPVIFTILLLSLVLSIVGLARRRAGGRPVAATALAVSGFGLLLSIAVAINSAVSPAVVAEPEVVWSDPLPDAPIGTDYGPVQPLKVVETAVGPEPGADYWWYAVIVDNPNADYIFEYAEFQITAVGADGEIVAATTTYPVVLQGTAAVTGSFSDIGDAVIDHVDVVAPARDQAVPSRAADTGTFMIRGPEVSTDEYSTTGAGAVSGTFDVDIEYVSVVTLARDPADEIIAVQNSFAAHLPAGGSWASFEVWFPEPLPDGTTYEAYASL